MPNSTTSYSARWDPPAAADAAWDLVRGEGMDEVRRAALLLAHGPRRVRATGYWLAGRAADRIGMLDDAENHYEQALSVDSGFVLAMFDLAWLAADRSDIVRCQSLFERAFDGADDAREDAHDLFAAVAAMAPRPHPELGETTGAGVGPGAGTRCVTWAGRGDQHAGRGVPVPAGGDVRDGVRRRRGSLGEGTLTRHCSRAGRWTSTPRAAAACSPTRTVACSRRGVRSRVRCTRWSRRTTTAPSCVTCARCHGAGARSGPGHGDRRVITARALPVGENLHLFDWYSVSDEAVDELIECLDEDDAFGILDVLGDEAQLES